MNPPFTKMARRSRKKCVENNPRGDFGAGPLEPPLSGALGSGSGRPVTFPKGPLVQNRQDNCGPTAIRNVMLFFGVHLDMYYVEAAAGCREIWGTIKGYMTNAMKNIRLGRGKSKIDFFECRYPKIHQLEKWLDAGHKIIYLYYRGTGVGHYIVLAGHTKGRFLVVNEIFYDGNRSKGYKSKRYYANRARVNAYYPHAWVVRGIKKGRKK